MRTSFFTTLAFAVMSLIEFTATVPV